MADEITEDEKTDLREQIENVMGLENWKAFLQANPISTTGELLNASADSDKTSYPRGFHIMAEVAKEELEL